VSTRTVERWEEREELPAARSSRELLARLREIVDLGAIVYGSANFKRYLTLPMRVFDGRSALQLLERGELDRVLGALAADYEGQGF
jgi:hypothetical protein